MPWRIPEADIDRVKRDTDLAALAQSRGIELKKHGRDLIGRCPFHNDQGTPNFIVSPGKGLWHCMACGKAGNAIQFVQQHDGLSFRHAFELLRTGGKAIFTARPLTRQSTVPLLPCPLDAEADDAALFAQVAAYYHERLKHAPTARAYLASRGLDNEELIDRFQIGFADRTLGLRLPNKNRAEGERLRSRLIQLGLWRESGHEHFNGCIVVPFQNQAGNVVSLYGRRVQRGDLKHLYLPGPHRGLFNPECLTQPEIILCEAVFDALTFWVNGFRNVTCLYGTEGFTDELWEAVKKVRRVRIAYDADDAGERAAQRDAERFKAHGIEVHRVKFPHGMDANEYACKVKPADKSLALPQEALTPGELDRLLSIPNVADPLGVRDRAMLELFYSCGLRRAELCQLQQADLNAERQTLRVFGKGKKDRIVPVGLRALQWVERYLKEVRPRLCLDTRTQALFITGYGDAFNPDVLSRMVSAWLLQAGLKKKGCCHVLRHTCATHMLENGADIRFIQQLLGHEKLDTTAIYTEVSIKQLQEVHARCHPSAQAVPAPNAPDGANKQTPANGDGGSDETGA